MVLPPHQGDMHYYMQRYYHTHERRSLLQRSVFHLIMRHVSLALTDSRLQEWYYYLCKKDKKIILDDGGLSVFLQRHPALEVVDNWVYVKWDVLAQPVVTSSQRKSHAAGAKRHTEESHQMQQRWDMFGSRAYQVHLGENSCHQPVHLQDCYHEPYPFREMPCCERKVTHFSSSPLLLLNENTPPFQMSNHSNVAEYEDQAYLQSDDPTSEHPTANGTAACQHHSLNTDGDTLLESREPAQSDQSLSKVNTAEKCTSPLPCVQTWNAAVGTEAVPCTTASTQTEDAEQTDKHFNTEVYMLDLDCLTKEIIPLKTTNQKLKESKENGSGCKLCKKCDCIQRAQQAELSLLAVQYIICKQHCWRLYYISAEGDQLAMTKEPPENIVNVLQKLELDYNQMKQKILSGVPLRVLKPLSVDSEKITRRASYTPAQIIGDVLGDSPSWMSSEPQEQNVSGEENMHLEDESLNTCQVKDKSRTVHTNDHDNVCKSTNKNRAVTLVLQDRAKTQEQTESSATYRDHGIGTTGEDLQLSGPADDDGLISEGAENSILYISNLPNNVTEIDVRLLCEKYRPSDVRLSALKNGFRVAMVMVSGAQSAETAVKELNGHQLQGNALHLEHIDRAVCGSGLEVSKDASEPQTSNTDTSSSDRELKTPPPLITSARSKMVVSDSPTAKGTFVPQHHGSMAGFDTQRHPEVGKQRIVDTLMELGVSHHGTLSSLSLKTIREIMSDILNQPAPGTQS